MMKNKYVYYICITLAFGFCFGLIIGNTAPRNSVFNIREERAFRFWHPEQTKQVQQLQIEVEEYRQRCIDWARYAWRLENQK